MVDHADKYFDSNSWFKLLEMIGIWGSGVILLAGVPVGILGIVRAKSMEKLRKTSFVLSIINLAAGSMELVMLVLIFCSAVFGGMSV